MEKHYWKKNELLFLKECYLKYEDNESYIIEFQKKYLNITADQIKRAFLEHTWLKEN